ncbi:MAG: putative GTP-binding protein [Parcubacteria group bacterium Gr01-1014_48]|nr:MAG: putative GTP-binding protein [Parcubacteria group bacterium Greene0416_14]TSC72258.1 MAG: putative GTP-binding protein [Parcubacteria group bacterium Gr01-1014_48]
MFQPRILEHAIRRAVTTFPAIVVTGPRQSGKTTLLRQLFGMSHHYVSLEDPNIRIRAKEDPVGFLNAHKPPVIFDEIQYIPELLSYIKTRIDADRTPGQWLITGSQNFVLMRGVSESLAGRAAVLSLPPLSFAERIGTIETAHDPAGWIAALDPKASSKMTVSLTEQIFRGGYPELALNFAVDRQLWCSSYIATYLERDIRNLTTIGDLSQFERFVRLCATRTGQVLNLTDFARDIGISVPTAKRWLSILETGMQIYLLYPYYRNIGKRLIKSPKLYFNDTALASYLLGLHNEETLLKSSHFGALFETMIIGDMVKRFLNFGQMPSLYYLRTRDGLEIDAVLDIGDRLHLFEIKATATVVPKHAASIIRLRADMDPPPATTAILSLVTENQHVTSGVENYSWQYILAL